MNKRDYYLCISRVIVLIDVDSQLMTCYVLLSYVLICCVPEVSSLAVLQRLRGEDQLEP